jgi:ribosomal-protein-alanine N-acetyltransferase
METRLITSGDAAVLAALHADSFGAAAWNLTQISDSLALPTTRGWLAFDADKPVGFILCQFTSDEAEILTFCTSPAARRKGIGRTLVVTALDAARAQKTQRIFLEVAVDNHAAIALYEKAGFKTIGTRANYYQCKGQSMDAVILEKDLLV